MSNIFVGSHNNIEINASCTYDHGADVSLSFNFNLNNLTSTAVSKHRGCLPLDLTIDEAFQLGGMLIKYADQARHKKDRKTLGMGR